MIIENAHTGETTSIAERAEIPFPDSQTRVVIQSFLKI